MSEQENKSVQATSDNAKGVDISYHEPNGTVKEMKSELIYGLNDKPPVKDAFFAALQHLLAIFVAIVTPPLIIAGALNFDIETTSFLVSMSLFASGISTFIQCRKLASNWLRSFMYSGYLFFLHRPNHCRRCHWRFIHDLWCCNRWLLC